MNRTLFVLASRSPRRSALLRRMGFVFHTCGADCDESFLPGESPGRYTRRMARTKSERVADRYPGAWILGGDTVVAVEDRILGKPEDEEDARRMLALLSGRTHEVITSYCFVHRRRKAVHLRSVKSRVEFKPLSPEEIDRYVRTGEPLDKAGAYAVQGVGAFMVRAVFGSYTNVVGLPIAEVIESMIDLAIIPGFPLEEGPEEGAYHENGTIVG